MKMLGVSKCEQQQQKQKHGSCKCHQTNRIAKRVITNNDDLLHSLNLDEAESFFRLDDFLLLETGQCTRHFVTTSTFAVEVLSKVITLVMKATLHEVADDLSDQVLRLLREFVV